MKTTAQTRALQYIAANGGIGVTVGNAAAPIASILVLKRDGLVTTEHESVRRGRNHISIAYATLTDAGRAAFALLGSALQGGSVTPLSITAPLRSLLDLSGLTETALGARCSPPLAQSTVGSTLARGDRIKLATLAAYARAAGWRLRIGFDAALYDYPADDLDVTVAGARALLAALGLEMTMLIAAELDP